MVLVMLGPFKSEAGNPPSIFRSTPPEQTRTNAFENNTIRHFGYVRVTRTFLTQEADFDRSFGRRWTGQVCCR